MKAGSDLTGLEAAVPVRRRPIYGGPFGNGRYELASQPTVANGLHAVRFYVLDVQAGAVLAIAETKLEALACARRVLRAGMKSEISLSLIWEQFMLWTEAELSLVAVGRARRHKPISRRRREVFDKSGGKCHYCPTPLTLDGRWHVEHMMPKALGGADEIGNLVAACPRCNLAKRDRTAIEYVMGRARS